MQQNDLSILMKTQLFAGIEQQQLSEMMDCLSPPVFSYRKEETVMGIGDPLRGVGIVLSGGLEIAKESAAGDKVILAQLGPSDIFAEVIALSGASVSPVSVRALEDGRVLYFPVNMLLGECPKMCPGHRKLIGNTVLLVAKKALQLNQKIDYLLIKGMRDKLCTFLYRLFQATGDVQLSLPFNRNELADFLNVSRPSMSRELGRMREEGWIALEGRSCRLLDLRSIMRHTQ